MPDNKNQYDSMPDYVIVRPCSVKNGAGIIFFLQSFNLNIMKHFLHIIPLALIISLSGSTFISCSSHKATVIEKRAEMPTNYPQTSGPVLQKLSNAVPDDAQMLAFTSYGSIAELIAKFDKYQLVDTNELKNTLNDLGKHYHLNPTKLKDYYDAGLNTGSGMVAGYRDNNLFFVIDTLDNDLFKKWLDIFINEEFGRPTYQESVEDNHTFIEISVLHKDFCSLVITPNEPVLLVMGPEILPDSVPSLTAAKAIINQHKLGSDAEKIIQTTNDSPVSICLNSHSTLLTSIPDNIRQTVTDWISSVTLNLLLPDNGPELRLSILYQDGNYQNMPRGKYLTSLLSGNNSGHAQSILSSNPASSFRLFANTEALESILLPQAPQNIRNSYNDIKGKLTQKLIKLDVSEQIIYNIGAIWLNIYPATPDNDELKNTATNNDDNSSLQTILNQQLAIYVSFKNTKNADTFFSKLNVLKRFVPENMATIDQENDMLHARMNYQQSTIHAGYHGGMFAIATDSAWPLANQVLTRSDAPDIRSHLTDETQFLATHLDLKNLSELPAIKNFNYSSQIQQLSQKFKSIDIHSQSNESMMNINISAELAF